MSWKDDLKQQLQTGQTITQAKLYNLIDNVPNPLNRTVKTDLSSTNAANDTGENILPGVSGTLPKTNGGTGNTNGNADTATKLLNPRTLKVDLGSSDDASFDGSSNQEIGVSGLLPTSNISNFSVAHYSADTPPHWDTSYSMNDWIRRLTAYEYFIQRSATKTNYYLGDSNYLTFQIDGDAIIFEIIFDAYNLSSNKYAKIQTNGLSFARDLVSGGSSFPYGYFYAFKSQVWIPTGGNGMILILPQNISVTSASSPQGSLITPVPLGT